jgi:hypothetical protein
MEEIKKWIHENKFMDSDNPSSDTRLIDVAELLDFLDTAQAKPLVLTETSFEFEQDIINRWVYGYRFDENMKINADNGKLHIEIRQFADHFDIKFMVGYTHMVLPNNKNRYRTIKDALTAINQKLKQIFEAVKENNNDK